LEGFVRKVVAKKEGSPFQKGLVVGLPGLFCPGGVFWIINIIGFFRERGSM